ncbi:hypothetical protein DTO96_100553 [Ephemeroptericola cinctiostellae]|uniref:Lipoprotein n=1 Tax=Ephemeroptericola cinctiostellae TaxID=2268024 RepID=A0A345D905_9BURK|nr:hypothetical protein [Ephemeroptericola cinctiostellae]AXF84843.1 hypothetical protein DTO96_100553 [Ephemeroptericola cinctiostellae]
MKQRIIITNLLLICGLTLSGCTSTFENVSKSKDTQLQYDNDKFYCDKQSKLYISRREYGDTAELEKYSFIDRCMKAAGWRKVSKTK